MIDDGDNPDPAPLTSCTRDEAVGMMLGLISGPEQARPINDDATPDELEIIYSHTYYLQEDRFEHEKSLEIDLAEAKADNLPEDVITEKREALEKFRALNKKTKIYLCHFDDEIAKGEKSELRIDQQATDSSPVTRFTLYSVDQWARKNYGIPILDQSPKPVTENPSTQTESQQQNEPESRGLPPCDGSPWSIPVPNDPIESQPWYRAARYFARQLVKDDSTLLTKRDVLARRIVQSLTGVGIYKRGERPFNPGTIKKALSKVLLG